MKIIRVILFLLFLITVFIEGTSFLGGAWRIGGVLFIISVALLPVFVSSSGWLGVRILFVVATLGTVSLFPTVFVDEAQSRMDTLWLVVKSGGSKSLQWNERSAIWGGNIIMAAGVSVMGYPEVAKETFHMSISGAEERIWKSDFALSSPKIFEPLSQFSQNLPKDPSEKSYIMDPVLLTWRNYEADRRVAFALNAPSKLYAEARHDGKEWFIEGKIITPVDYPEESRTKVFSIGGKPFFVEEGLFHALEELGWLFPYQAVWVWKMKASELKLDNYKN